MSFTFNTHFRLSQRWFAYYKDKELNTNGSNEKKTRIEMYVQRNILVRSRNRCGSQRNSALCIFSTLPNKGQNLRKNGMADKMLVDFLQILSLIFFIKKNSDKHYLTNTEIFMESTRLFWSGFNQT
jgi:hypothetical protein